VGSFATADEVRRAVHGSGELPDRALLVTFDDGLREQVAHALPVLQRLGIPAVFFVSTQPIASGRIETVHKIHLMRSQTATRDFLGLLGRQAAAHGISLTIDLDDEVVSQYPYDSPDVAKLKYLLNSALPVHDAARLIDACFAEVFPGRESAMSEQLYMDVSQVRMVASLGFLGSHGHHHLPLGLIGEAEAAREIALSVYHLRRWTGSAPFALSYPYGSKSACPAALGPLCEVEGIEFAFTMERTTNRNFQQPLFLGRFDAKDVPSDREAARQLLFGAPTSAGHDAPLATFKEERAAAGAL
jgi:peptidoglycan/xylan/chitin deacetylase (PgdA/CDA1 family)